MRRPAKNATRQEKFRYAVSRFLYWLEKLDFAEQSQTKTIHRKLAYWENQMVALR